jgi:hypothetical protein
VDSGNFQFCRITEVLEQGCQMVYFQTKNPNLVKLWEYFAMKYDGQFYGHLVNFTATSYILWPFGIFLVILVFFPVWVCCTKKNLADVLWSRFFKYFVFCKNFPDMYYIRLLGMQRPDRCGIMQPCQERGIATLHHKVGIRFIVSIFMKSFIFTCVPILFICFGRT